MKVIIAGSRDIEDYELIDVAVRESGFTVTEVVSGTARGVDKLGEQWAEEYNIPIKRFKPDWSIGRSAGIIRNTEMVAYADALIAIWDGYSRDTKHMIDYAKSRGLMVYVLIME